MPWLRIEPPNAQPARWQGLIGPAVAGLGMLLLIALVLSM
jgi:hypothetical protein